MWNNRKLWIGALIVVGLAAFILLVQMKNTEDVNIIKVSGNIEVTEVESSFKIAGRIAERYVEEGHLVKAGEVIARLDETDFRQEASLREAELEQAKAALSEALEGYLPEEISQALAKLNRSKAEVDKMEKDFARQQQLYNDQVISDREFEASQSAYQIAKARFQEAKEYHALLKRGTRQEKIDQAQAQVKRAESALQIAMTKLSYTILKSPIDGYVLSKNAEAGEYVSAGTPIVTIGNMADPWLRAYIHEKDLGKVKLGQTVYITTDTFPGKKYPGKISFISSEAEFTPKNVQTQRQRVKLVYRIKVAIPNPEMELKLGMPADGSIVLNG
jgi:HlyD family secretion protein